ncbi:hypothetical protein C7S14_3173 [Burkholderia cepacia]|nr:hypothetical protein [Burkholderia cepacia]QOH38370.1 hypothetical protein C7S14_3173 [Burkholderia cepacia]
MRLRRSHVCFFLSCIRGRARSPRSANYIAARKIAIRR